jgi:DNA-binding response OmpR family regulator
MLDGAEFDAVFTDIGMKGMSGWELAHAVRERDPGVPLAVITGWGDAVSSGERSVAQVDWVVTKPFDAAQILAIAREVARRAEARAKSAGVAA